MYNLNDLHKYKKQVYDNFEQAQSDKVKYELKTTLSKNTLSSFIYALDEFEKTFGKSWGFGHLDEDLTDTQRNVKKIYESLRKKILDNGNEQIRKSMNEVDRFDFKSKTIRIFIKGKNDE